jgi:hypothetical protein
MKSVLVGLSLFVLSSCTYKEYKDNPTDNIRIQSIKPFYNSIQAGILGPSCVECHTGPGSRGKSDLSTYEGVLRFVVKGQPEASRLITVLVGRGGNMPLEKSPLDPREIQVLSDWIQSGAPLDETQEPPPPPEEVMPDYESINRLILGPACIECHSEALGRTEGDLDLTTYINLTENILYPDLIVKGDAEKSLLYTDVRSGRMPWKRTPLSEKEIIAIRDWINAGAKEK